MEYYFMKQFHLILVIALLEVLYYLVLIIVHLLILIIANRCFGSPEKKFSINFIKAKTKFCLSLHYNHNNSYFFVNGNL